MRFVYPFLLLLLSLIPLIGVLWLWLYRRAQRRLALLIAPALQPKLMPAHPKSAFYAQFSLVMVGLTLLVFAAARPQWGRKDEKSSHADAIGGRPRRLAFDLAADVTPTGWRAPRPTYGLIEDLKATAPRC
jgi:hypothetical protein